MNPTKIPSRVAIFALAATVVALLIDNARLRQQDDRSRSVSARGGVAAQNEQGLSPGTSDAPLDRVGSETPAELAPVAEVEIASRTSDLAAVRALWADPKFRMNSVEQAITRNEERYGRFFFSLNSLPEDQRERIKLLLATQSVDAAEIAMNLDFSGGPEAAERRSAMLRDFEESQQAELQATMGDDVYRRFRAAQQTEVYREAVSSVANGMRAQGIAVDDMLQEKMLEAYTSAMAGTVAEAVKGDGVVDPAALSPAERRSLRERQVARLHLHLASAMKGVLDESALDAFIATQMERDVIR